MESFRCIIMITGLIQIVGVWECCHPLYFLTICFSPHCEEYEPRLRHLSTLLILPRPPFVTTDKRLYHYHSEWPEGIQDSPRFITKAGLKTSSFSLRTLPRRRTGRKITRSHLRRWWMGGRYLLHISRCLLSFIHVHYPSSGNIYRPSNESPLDSR